MDRRKWLPILATACSAALLAPSAVGSLVTFETAPGSTTVGGPVDASATFAITGNTLTVTLQDLLANPTDVAQVLSDLMFSINAPTAGTTLSTSSAQEISIDGSGHATLGATGTTGWTLSSPGSGTLLLCVICAGGNAPVAPAHLLIGPAGPGGVYTNANGSIANNGPHNPFLNQTASFTITSASFTSDTTVTSALFSFGTTPGIEVPGVPTFPRVPPTAVPEPGTLVLLGAAFLGLRASRRRKTA